MAIYRCEVKNISRGQGRSCVAAAAYRHGQELHDERQDMNHSYSHKHDVQHSEIIAPANAPAWVNDRATLWNSIDAAEKRKDARTAKEILVALPRELTKEQQVEAVREFCRTEFAAKGLVADFAIHAPDARDGEKQPHAHVMVSTRALEGEGWAKGKDKALDQPQGIEAIRERWADHCNRALERADLGERVTHLSLKKQRQVMLSVAVDNTKPAEEREEAQAYAQWLDRPPEPKIGPVALKMERQGRGGDALALRDALEVRQERGTLPQLVEAWQRVRAEVLDLANQVKEAVRSRSPALSDGELLTEWEKSRRGRANIIRARADKLAEKITGQIDRIREARAGHIRGHEAQKPQKPGWFEEFRNPGRYEANLTAWGEKAAALKNWCRQRENSLDRRLGRLKGYLSRDHIPGYTNRADQKAEQQIRAKHPDLAKRYDQLQEAQREARRAEIRERMEQQRAKDRSRGRGGHSR